MRVRARAQRVVIAAAIAIQLLATQATAAPPLVPKVALIVGPVGSLTAMYRSLANEAAAEARAAGAAVVKVYSPWATWPAVRRAISGASIVVYLGHGNGWPSRYRDTLYPPTQNGFGLNPVAGDDDLAHQYFGEASIDDVQLAPHAVVLLHHLCYASGNTEPGLPEGTFGDALQRVDNYAAGFIRAGAAAVVAEGHFGPAWYVHELLRGQRSIEAIWRASPSAHGHTTETGSTRSPGYVAHLDPDHARSGFYRSLVAKGVTAAQVRAGSGRSESASIATVVPPQPSLADAGITFGTLQLVDAPVASTTVHVALPWAGGVVSLPRELRLGVRWDPIEVDRAPLPAGVPPVKGGDLGPPRDAAGSSGPAAIDSPSVPPSTDQFATGGATRLVGGGAGSAAGVDPAGTGEVPIAADPPPVDLVAPERLGSVVDITPARAGRRRITATLAYPDEPGLYRLVPTLHSASGVAYDAATQGRLRPVIVRVRGPVAVVFGVPAQLRLPAGGTIQVPIRIVNAGSEPWEQPLRPGLITRLPAQLTASWLSPTGNPVPAPASAVLDAEALEPRGQSVVVVRVHAPTEPGDYLLVEDVISPSYGALSMLGNEPGIVRVRVTGSGDGPLPTGSAPGADVAPAPASPGVVE